MADRDDRRIFFDPRAVAEWMNSRFDSPVLACDIESDGLGADAYRIKCVTFSDGLTSAILDPRDPEQADVIRQVCDVAAGGLVFHNSPFDVPVMAANGLLTPDLAIPKIRDLLIYARLARPSQIDGKSLDALASDVLGFDGSKIGAAMKAAGYRNQRDGYAGLDIDSFVWASGAMADARATMLLTPTMVREARTVIEAVQDGPWSDWAAQDVEALLHREQTVNQVMLAAGCRGMDFDREYYDAWTDEFVPTIEAAAAKLEAEDLPPGDGAKLVERLDSLGALPARWPRTGKTKQLAARAEDIEKLTHPLALAHLDYKQRVKDRGYLEKCAALAAVTGRVYLACGVLGASTTGRMSYSTPEVHQFPGTARGCLLADKAGLTSIDWAAIEPATIANIAGERAMLEAYEAGLDIYLPAMEAAEVSRKDAKVVLLAGMYGQGKALLASKLSHARGVDITPDEALEIQATVMGTMPAVKGALDMIKWRGTNHGFVVTVAGRPVPVPFYPADENGRGGYAGYKGMNYVVQGSAYDQLADTIVRGHAEGLSGTLRIAMHDELVVDTDTADAWQRLMSVPSADFCRAVERTPVLRTDREDMGVRWLKPE
ncbi:DNA polymerase I [Nocardia phage NBR1]|uniref:DNA polymerase I n=1 Tax=Nocardia phage NBR1 TaxID=1109711 RepID=UPI00023EEDFB|nr:DNA polymerase I [Nocardia phage NBR1]AEV52269.1 DNA polymerase I [Nocardia phage NBR1]